MRSLPRRRQLPGRSGPGKVGRPTLPLPLLPGLAPPVGRGRGASGGERGRAGASGGGQGRAGAGRGQVLAPIGRSWCRNSNLSRIPPKSALKRNKMDARHQESGRAAELGTKIPGWRQLPPGRPPPNAVGSGRRRPKALLKPLKADPDGTERRPDVTERRPGGTERRPDVTARPRAAASCAGDCRSGHPWTRKGGRGSPAALHISTVTVRSPSY